MAFALRQRAALGDELAVKHRRKDFQDQLIAETNDEVGACGEKMRRCDSDRGCAQYRARPATIGTVGTPGLEGLKSGRPAVMRHDLNRHCEER